jgi:CRP-like cAMP-binding protein
VTSPRPPERQPLEAALRQIAIFSDLRDDELQWFASNAEELRFAPGDTLLHEGDPADALFVVLEGEIRGRKENGGADAPSFVGRAGQVIGLLPFSRMTNFPLTARATAPAWLLRLHKSRFE